MSGSKEQQKKCSLRRIEATFKGFLIIKNNEAKTFQGVKNNGPKYKPLILITPQAAGYSPPKIMKFPAASSGGIF